jgi:hypothetical protein
MARWLFQADNRRLKTTHLCRYSAFAAFSFWTTLGTLLSNSSNFVQIRTAVQNTTRIQRKTRIVVILQSNLLVWFRQLTVSRMALQLCCGLRVSAPMRQIVDGGISRGTSGFPKKTVSLGFIARQWSPAP